MIEIMMQPTLHNLNHHGYHRYYMGLLGNYSYVRYHGVQMHLHNSELSIALHVAVNQTIKTELKDYILEYLPKIKTEVKNNLNWLTDVYYHDIASSVITNG